MFERERLKDLDLSHTDRKWRDKAMDLYKLFKGENTQGLRTESVEMPMCRMWKEEKDLTERLLRGQRRARMVQVTLI